MAKVGVVLSGCGFLDGSEIHEATLTLFYLDRAGAEIIQMAPDIEQSDVVNHLLSEPVAGETRNVLVESARIARGNVKDIAQIKVEDIDALVFPGGFGAAKNLCDFAAAGTDCQVDPEVSRLVKGMISAGKPVGLACIAPVLAARIAGDLGGFKPTVTIGNDGDTAAAVEKMGGAHQNCGVTEIVIDSEHRIVTTPAYMLADRISQVFDGIDKMVREVLTLVK